jgi:sulfatase maturation enzyme AslB (radical SAM superfamily)
MGPRAPLTLAPREEKGFWMKTIHVLKAWGRILAGHAPSLSIEITKECPLRCPGCYAYDDGHLGGGVTLRQLTDYKGDKLVEAVLALVRRERPLHLSIVGGDPLVRYRELEILVPQLHDMGVYLQVVTSAFRVIPPAWVNLPRVKVVVSIDGLQPEHDERRKPATYERILKNIAGHRITIHSTITGQQMKSPGYLEEFLRFWAPREEVRQIWMSMFTPQKGAVAPEILTRDERRQAIEELLRLRLLFPKLDMRESLIREFQNPPATPHDCIFARTTETVSADLKTKIVPCQYGGDPDCSQCGCVASMALAAVGSHKIAGIMPVKPIYMTSARIGEIVAGMRNGRARRGEKTADTPSLKVLPDSSSATEV